MSSANKTPFVSRAGAKLAHALDEFALDVNGLECADFGCNVGGFTDCLLQRGATRVHAIDTGYGTLAWKLRQDDRVVVSERTNALHADPPMDNVDLVVVDLGWTPQRHALPAALRWLRPAGRIISLVKPHYETSRDERDLLVRGGLEPADAERILARTIAEFESLGVHARSVTQSPLVGGKSRRNVEFLVLAEPLAEAPDAAETA